MGITVVDAATGSYGLHAWIFRRKLGRMHFVLTSCVNNHICINIHVWLIITNLLVIMYDYVIIVPFLLLE